jgi:thiamine biosynthesis lipoprotein
MNITKISMQDMSVCTSGDTKSFSFADGKQTSHIISKTKSKYKQVSVVAPTAVDTGVWSAVMLMNAKLKLPTHVNLVSTVL